MQFIEKLHLRLLSPPLFLGTTSKPIIKVIVNIDSEHELLIRIGVEILMTIFYHFEY